MKTSYVLSVMLMTILFTSTIMSTPLVFADPLPQFMTIPQNVIVGSTTIDLQFTAVGNGQQNGKIRVWAPNINPGAFAAQTLVPPPPVCGLPAPSGGQVAWDLVKVSDGLPVIYSVTPGQSFKVKFGLGAATTIDTSGGGTTNAGVNQVQWKEVTSGTTDTDAVSQTVGDYHRVTSCGFDINQTPVQQYELNQPVGIQAPVGGSILPINSALLVAGLVASNSIWIMPLLGIAAISGYQVYKKSKHD